MHQRAKMVTVATAAISVAFLTFSAAPPAAHAACDTSICTGASSSCTITGNHMIDNLCVLDFGTKSVTVAKGAKLDGKGGQFEILAGDLFVLGELESQPGGFVDIDVIGDFETDVVNNSAGRLDFREGEILVVAGGDCTIDGKDFQTNGSGGDDGGDIEIDCGGDVNITEPIDASGGGSLAGGGLITIAGGSVTATAILKAVGTQEGDGGRVAIVSTGAISIDDVNLTGSGTNAFGGDLDIDSDSSATISGRVNTNGGPEGTGGQISIFVSGAVDIEQGADITCTAGGDGTGCDFVISAGGDVTVNGDVDASGTGADSSAGTIDIATSDADITVGASSALTADTPSGGFSNGTIYLGPACDITVEGRLDTRTNSVGSGGNEIFYRETLDLTMATLLADDDTGNDIFCRCVNEDGNPDNCDAPPTCITNPMTSGGSFTPALGSATPSVMTACP